MSQNTCNLVTMTRMMFKEGGVKLVVHVVASPSATMMTQMCKLSNERIRSTLLRE
jgi:hypothetical protein